ncbi:MAG TPA: hypothetical protein VKR52_18955 [Terracidiphilus sp.]|nr:hypothetical protein [Terracidiphilus sp.]
MCAARPIERKLANPRLALLLLCLVWAFASLRADVAREISAASLPSLERQSIPYVLFALVSASFAVVRRVPWHHKLVLPSALLVGLGMFAAPALLVHLSEKWLPDLTSVALFSLTPVFAVVFEPFFADAAARHRTGLFAALCSVTGTLLFVPVEMPHSLVQGLAFAAVVFAAACVAAANCLAVRTALCLEAQSIAPMAAIASGCAVMVLALFSGLLEHPVLALPALASEIAWSALFDLPALLLLFWLLRRMPAAPMTTRFVLTPLFASLIVIPFLQPRISLRAAIGMLLMAAGSGWMIYGPQASVETDASPLKLRD